MLNINVTSNDTKTLYSGEANKHNSNIKQRKNNQKQVKNGTFFAGNLGLNGQDHIEAKKTQAQKQAMKLKLDQLKKDNKVDDTIGNVKENKEKYSMEAAEAQKEIKNIRAMRDELKETYEIDDQSNEQSDLKLLEKSMDPEQSLTKEELEKLKNMGPLTDYQKETLRYDTMEEVFKQRLDNAINGIENADGTIISIKLELLKTHPMVDAQNEAAEIMENASREAIGMLMDDAVKHVDEEQKKTKEEAEKAAEKKEEEKKTEDVSQNGQEPLQDDLKDITEADAENDKIVTELKKFIEKNNILEDDAKGIVLDELL